MLSLLEQMELYKELQMVDSKFGSTYLTDENQPLDFIRTLQPVRQVPLQTSRKTNLEAWGLLAVFTSPCT